MSARNETTSYGRQRVGDVEVFFRAAGPADAPVVLLLHGFPSASTCSAICSPNSPVPIA